MQSILSKFRSPVPPPIAPQAVQTAITQTSDTARHGHVTQALSRVTCATCGTEAETGADVCRRCGAELGQTALATTRIAAGEASERGWWLVVAGFIALLLIGLALGSWRARQAQTRSDPPTTTAPGNNR